MNTLKIIVLALASIVSAYAQGTPRADRRPAQITFRVLTDEGAPVSNVEVTTSTFLRWQPGEGFGQDIYEETKARTNADGLATVSFTSERGDCNYGIYDAPGYYSTRNLTYRFKEVEARRWEPWNPTIDVVCKPIIKPIPMYARKMGDPTRLLELPVKGKPVGFDLVVGAWVAPYGEGKVADLVFTLKEAVPKTDPAKAFDYTLSVTFSNIGDGIQSVLAPPFKGSELRLPRYAPEAGYEAELVKRIGRPEAGQPLYTSSREDQNYFFRVRTVLDEHGNIKSALYGKILGNIECDVINSPKGYVIFSYCLNPNSLDRNMESDPRKGLFGELPFSLRVNEP